MKRSTALILALAILISLPGCSAALAEETTIPPATATPTETETVSLQEIALDIPAISITEVMPDNEQLCLGHDQEWVELYNAEETAVRLDGWYLSDDPMLKDVMDLSGLEIPAEDYLVVTLNGTFGLSANGETVYLTYETNPVSQLTFDAAQNSESFSQEGPCRWPSPGYDNTEAGYYAYLEDMELPELIISEVISSNSKHLPVKREYYDLVEVANISGQPINLSDYCLTDKYSDPFRYAFPEILLQPGEHYVVYCSGDSTLGQEHASFKVSSQGETLLLSKNGLFTDALTVPGDLQANESFGRVGKLPMYLEQPTFGETNGVGYKSGVSAPKADLPSGEYETAVAVALSGEGTIYYTTDGSRPTTRSQVYEAPIAVTDVSTIRTFCVSGNRSSEIVSYTYVIGKSHTLPVVVLSIPQTYLTGSGGLLRNVESKAEYEAVLTLVEDGEEKFSIPCGFRLHGNDSRKQAKKNFSLRFRSAYGESKLRYRLFEDRDIEEFNSILLKGGSEDWYKAMIRDELSSAIANGETNLYTQATKPVVLYMGDQYWGVYYLRERFSADYVASHLGVSTESVDIVYSNAGYTQDGDNTDFLRLREYVLTHDMRKDEHYRYVEERIDVQSLIDWYICRSFMGDRDTANIRRFRSSEYDNKWRWMYFDVDWGFSWINDYPYSGIATKGGDYVLMQGILRNEKGKDAFLSRYAYLMGTILNGEYINGLIDELVNAIEPEMPADRKHWKVSLEEWESEVQFVRRFVTNRRKRVLHDLKTYFGLSEEKMEHYFGD